MDTDKILIATFFCLIVHSIICLLKYFEDIHELGEKNSDQTTHSWTFSRVSISGRIAYILTWYKHSWCFSRLFLGVYRLGWYTQLHFQYTDPPKNYFIFYTKCMIFCQIHVTLFNYQTSKLWNRHSAFGYVAGELIITWLSTLIKGSSFLPTKQRRALQNPLLK